MIDEKDRSNFDADGVMFFTKRFPSFEPFYFFFPNISLLVFFLGIQPSLNIMIMVCVYCCFFTLSALTFKIDIYLGTYILPGGQSTATWIKVCDKFVLSVCLRIIEDLFFSIIHVSHLRIGCSLLINIFVTQWDFLKKNKRRI